MENNDDFNQLSKELENNIIDWYDFLPNNNYIVLKDLNKKNIDKLENAVQNLKENDRLLLAFDNSLSIKHFCQLEKQEDLFNRKEIEILLDKLGLVYRNFYYPLPDCSTTNVIFSDKHLPDLETISRNLVFYKNEEIKLNEQNKEFEKIIKQDKELFKIFANSFLIECSKFDFEQNDIEFVSYSNIRKEEYRIKTIIKGDKVYKTARNSVAKNHIENIKKNIDKLKELGLNTLDSYNGDCIISNYKKNEETLDKKVLKLINDNKENEAIKIITDLYNFLKEKLVVIDNYERTIFDKYNIEFDKSKFNEMIFVKNGFWDLVFSNIFYIDNKYYFFDQEWFEENIPLNYIIYRAFYYNKDLREFMPKIFNINSNEIELFLKLDEKIQENIRSSESWNLHTNQVDIELKILKYQDDIKKITEDCQKLLLEKDSRIKFLEENMEKTCEILKQKEDELNFIKNSVSWKVTKPIRYVRKILK